MDFTREPIIETIITSREGHKLVVRSSKASGQEEFFVDSVEVISFGSALFFRSLEKPKSFLVPTSDYEVLEVRETRMILKHVGMEKSIKIAGGKEGGKPQKEPAQERQPTPAPKVQAAPPEAHIASPSDAPIAEETPHDPKVDRKRDRRRHYRRRRGRDDVAGKEWDEEADDRGLTLDDEGELYDKNQRVHLPAPSEKEYPKESDGSILVPSNVMSSLLPPPAVLISETIAKYRDNERFKDVFITGAAEDIREDISGESQQEPLSEESGLQDELKADLDVVESGHGPVESHCENESQEDYRLPESISNLETQLSIDHLEPADDPTEQHQELADPQESKADHNSFDESEPSQDCSSDSECNVQKEETNTP